VDYIPTVVTERSAGGVIYRRMGDGGLEVCLIATKGGSRWQLPKGHINAGETVEQAAVRETTEETGLRGEMEGDLGEINFWYVANLPTGGRERRRKIVHFYLLRFLDGDTSLHDGEVDEARWFQLPDARMKITFESERQVLDRAAALANTGASVDLTQTGNPDDPA
jgi:8-oxo-dGTP pyrophosphatase MutT (NUDIX family)